MVFHYVCVCVSTPHVLYPLHTLYIKNKGSIICLSLFLPCHSDSIGILWSCLPFHILNVPSSSSALPSNNVSDTISSVVNNVELIGTKHRTLRFFPRKHSIVYSNSSPNTRRVDLQIMKYPLCSPFYLFQKFCRSFFLFIMFHLYLTETVRVNLLSIWLMK